MEGNYRNENMISESDISSDEKVRRWLFAIIDNELTKDESEIDYELIRLCSEYESELSDVTHTSDEEFEQILDKIKSKAGVTEEVGASKVLKPKKRHVFKVLAIAAIVTLTLTVSVSVIASKRGYSITEFVSDNLKKIVGMDSGEEYEEDKVSVVKNGVSSEYSSVEDAIIENDFDILYPSVLPDGVKITEIALRTREDSDEYSISFLSSSNQFSMYIQNYSLADIEYLESYEVHEAMNIKFYIIDMDGSYQSICQYNGLEYKIIYDNYEKLINIIDNMKGIDK